MGKIKVEYAQAFEPLFDPHRFKVFWGGRGAAKTWSFARALVNKAHTEKHRIGCFRELQNSIKDSVHQTIKDQIAMMGLEPWFDITEKSIRSTVTGSNFIFKGLRSNITEIKSTEGITIAWVEEAQLVSKDSWEILEPTIRVEGSEIWVSFNPIEEEDPTYQRFIVHKPPDALVVKVGWEDNPWFSETLDKQRRWMLASDPDAYEHVWNGACRVLSDDVIFRGKYVVECFDPPEYPNEPRFFHGADFGFAQDPATLVRLWTTGKAPEEELWIDMEAGGPGIEMDDLPEVYDKIPTSRVWPIKADNARPETISYLRRQGFNISAAEKWTGCVEDGISHLKAFKKIHIHERCKGVLQEARLYRFKRDRLTNQVLPIIIDRNNHYWDAIRYALDGYILRRGGHGVWGKL